MMKIFSEARKRKINWRLFSCFRKSEIPKLKITKISKGDILLVAGKGHEKYQEINGELFPFDDMAILKEHFKH